MATLLTRAEAQQEQIRMAQMLTQQLRANPTNPPPPFCAAFQKQATEGGVVKALDESSREQMRDLQDYCSGFLGRSMK